MSPHRADLRGAEPRSPGSTQEAARRPLEGFTSTSCTDQGPEPKPPPCAAAEANYQAVQPKIPSADEGAPLPFTPYFGGGSTRPPGPDAPCTSRPPGLLGPTNSPAQQTSSQFHVQNMHRGAKPSHIEKVCCSSSSARELHVDEHQRISSVMGKNYLMHTSTPTRNTTSPAAVAGRTARRRGEQRLRIAERGAWLRGRRLDATDGANEDHHSSLSL